MVSFNHHIPSLILISSLNFFSLGPITATIDLIECNTGTTNPKKCNEALSCKRCSLGNNEETSKEINDVYKKEFKKEEDAAKKKGAPGL